MNRFDEAAKTWDKKQSSIDSSNASVENLLDNCKIKEDAKILDYGCGTGFIAFALKNETNNIIGMDYSDGMIEQFNKKANDFELTNIKAVKHNMNEEELPKKEFDLVITSMTMHHIKDTNMFFKKCKESLKTNGVICINDLDKEDGTFHAKHKNDGVEHFGYTKEELFDLAKANELEVISYKLVYTHERNDKQYPLFNLILKA
jgi:ubiquinone/menaquinone biosynthesis C-methylase UbiE